jgi:hypothetical protein
MTDDDREVLQLLEGRRLAIDAAMWQGPTLTLVAQAFLLVVLTDSHVKLTVAIFVALAGIVALVVVGVSLMAQRGREVELSRRIEDHASAVGLPELRRPRTRGRSWWRPLDWPPWAVWALVIYPLFALADVLALVLTDRV